MKKNKIRCSICGNVFDKRLEKQHNATSWHLKHVKPTVDMSKNRSNNNKTEIPNPDSQMYTTDDSGIVIPFEQWAALHGEGNSNSPLSHKHWNVDSQKTEQTSAFASIKTETKGYVPQAKRVICGECGKLFSIKNFNNHLIYDHGFTNPNSVTPSENVTGTTNNSKKSKLKQSTTGNNKPKRAENKQILDINISDNLVPTGQEGNMAEAFHQAFSEKRDGGKELMKREGNGMFGSSPYYDRYDDESGSK
jgi:hypothetical protein